MKIELACVDCCNLYAGQARCPGCGSPGKPLADGLPSVLHSEEAIQDCFRLWDPEYWKALKKSRDEGAFCSVTYVTCSDPKSLHPRATSSDVTRFRKVLESELRKFYPGIKVKAKSVWLCEVEGMDSTFPVSKNQIFEDAEAIGRRVYESGLWKEDSEDAAAFYAALLRRPIGMSCPYCKHIFRTEEQYDGHVPCPEGND